MNTSSPRSAVRSLLTRYTLMAFVAGAALAGGVGVLAQSATGMHHGMMMGSGHSAADFSARLQHGCWRTRGATAHLRRRCGSPAARGSRH